MFLTTKEILEQAQLKGLEALKEAKANQPLGCGYVSIIIKPARGKFVNDLKKMNIGSRGVYGGYELTLSDFIGIIPNLQSIELKEAAIAPIEELLKANDIKCRVRSQLI